jgi:hypothetical protein
MNRRVLWFAGLYGASTLLFALATVALHALLSLIA